MASSNARSTQTRDDGNTRPADGISTSTNTGPTETPGTIDSLTVTGLDSPTTSDVPLVTTPTAPNVQTSFTTALQHTPSTTSRSTPSIQDLSTDASGASANGPTSSASPAAVSSTHNGYSGGSLAGGIVGAALGAAIITFLAMFFLCKRRHRRQSAGHGSYQEDPAQWTPLKTGAVIAEKPPYRSDHDGSQWQAYLPQSADDRTIQNAVKTLLNQIELHVDNYYHKAVIDLDENVKADLARVESDRLPAPLSTLISDQQLVLPVIKHCITRMLISKMTPRENTTGSLLPSRQATAPSKPKTSSSTAGEHAAVQQAYSEWRVLNAYLFARNHEDPSDNRRLQSATNDISESIYLAFMPWQADVKNDEALKQHQLSVISRAGDVGLLIQSQPSAYEFDWWDGSKAGRMVVLPGFHKMSDEQGRILEAPQTLIQPTIVSV